MSAGGGRTQGGARKEANGGAAGKGSAVRSDGGSNAALTSRDVSKDEERKFPGLAIPNQPRIDLLHFLLFLQELHCQ